MRHNKNSKLSRATRRTDAALLKGQNALAKGDPLSVAHSTAFQALGRDLDLSPDAFMRLEAGPKRRVKSKITMPTIGIQKKEP